VSANAAAVVLAVLGVVVSAVSAAVAVLALRRSSRRDDRIEQLETKAMALATSYVLKVEPSDPATWTLDANGRRVEELVAHVTNRGAVDSPPVTVRAVVDGGFAGESDVRQVGGKRTVPFAVKFDADTEASVPKPYGSGELELYVSVPHGHDSFMMAFWGWGTTLDA
jgi:hypothetical protein